MEHISLQHTSCLNGPKLDQYLKFNFTISLGQCVLCSLPFVNLKYMVRPITNGASYTFLFGFGSALSLVPRRVVVFFLILT